jgi:hypothetical protein
VAGKDLVIYLMKKEPQLKLDRISCIPNSTFFDSGRSALYYLIKVLEVNVIHIPKFRCKVIDNVIRKFPNLNYHEYNGWSINEIDSNPLCLLIINYFGLTYSLDIIISYARKNPKVLVILDEVHLYRSELNYELPENLFLILGYRKILFSDFGAVVLGNVPNKIEFKVNKKLLQSSSWLDANEEIKDLVILDRLHWFESKSSFEIIENRINKLNKITGKQYKLDCNSLVSYFPLVDSEETLRLYLYRYGIETFYYWKNFNIGYVQLPIHINITEKTFNRTCNILEGYV